MRKHPRPISGHCQVPFIISPLGPSNAAAIAGLLVHSFTEHFVVVVFLCVRHCARCSVPGPEHTEANKISALVELNLGKANQIDCERKQNKVRDNDLVRGCFRKGSSGMAYLRSNGFEQTPE